MRPISREARASWRSRWNCSHTWKATRSGSGAVGVDGQLRHAGPYVSHRALKVANARRARPRRGSEDLLERRSLQLEHTVVVDEPLGVQGQGGLALLREVDLLRALDV